MNQSLTKIKETKVDLLKRFLAAIEDGSIADKIDQFYAPEVLRTENPDLITPVVVTRKLQPLKKAASKNKKVISKQKYQVIRIHDAGEALILEAVWTGELAISFGKLCAGDIMRAWFAQFYQFRNGRIIRQGNYDCFKPF